MRCGFIHFPEMGEEEEDPAWACRKKALYTCCDYGGAVCADHKCRCSKPLIGKKMETEWRSPEEIIQGLLEVIQENEWIDTYVRCRRGCCGDWEYQCPSCNQNQKKGHSEHCPLALRIREAQAYLEPSTPGGLTVWDRLEGNEAISDHPA